MFTKWRQFRHIYGCRLDSDFVLLFWFQNNHHIIIRLRFKLRSFHDILFPHYNQYRVICFHNFTLDTKITSIISLIIFSQPIINTYYITILGTSN